MTTWVLVNPNAGGVRDRAEVMSIRRKLAGRAVAITSELPEPVAQGRRVVVAVGGDGTVNRVINHYDPARLRLGLIPRGSANDLAAELGVPGDVGGALRLIEECCFESIDLLTVNGTRFATCGGLGLLSSVTIRANGWKEAPGRRGRVARALGQLVYVLATLFEIRRAASRPVEALIESDEGVRRASLIMATVSNQPRFGGRFSCSPRASNRDGLLHLFGIEGPCSGPRLLWLCIRIFFGSCDRCKETFQMRARSLKIRTATAVTFCADGEPLARGRGFSLGVLPHALEVAAPPRPASGRGSDAAG